MSEKTFLHKALDESGVGQTGLAERMGVSRQAVHNALRLELKPRTLVVYLRALNWSDERIAAITLGELL